MATEKDLKNTQPAATEPVIVQAARFVEVEPEPVRKLDETVPGGRYIRGDRYVDANAKDLGPVKKANEE
jgi:hypothetical protein